MLSLPEGPASARPEVTPSWSASTPNVPGAAITSLASVACVTNSDCWAVGDRFRLSSSHAGPALIEHYTSGSWKPVSAAAAQPGTLDELSGVGCLSATNCWAVGSRSGSQRGNLLEHLGTQERWSVVATPAPQGQLYAVTCEAGNAQCWAVGSSSDFRHVITFRLIAGSWRYVRPAPLQASFVQVSGVASATADDCLLVGFATPAHGVGQALAERWNGRGWSRVSVAGELSGGGSLAGVGCGPGNSPTVCWAVGRTVTRAASLIPIHPLVERWNGNSLALVPSPPGSAGNYPGFTAIACASSTACQAVGRAARAKMRRWY